MKRQLAKSEWAKQSNTTLSREQIEEKKRIARVRAQLGLAPTFDGCGILTGYDDIKDVKFTYYEDAQEYLVDKMKAYEILIGGGDLSEELYTKLLKSKQEIDAYHEVKYANVKPKIVYTDK